MKAAQLRMAEQISAREQQAGVLATSVGQQQTQAQAQAALAQQKAASDQAALNAQAAQQAQAMSARGGANAALAFRGAANNTAAVGLSGAGQAQQAALTDQQTAQGQLSNVLNQGRGQDQSQIGLQQTQYANNNAANSGDWASSSCTSRIRPAFAATS